MRAAVAQKIISSVVFKKRRYHPAACGTGQKSISQNFFFFSSAVVAVNCYLKPCVISQHDLSEGATNDALPAGLIVSL